MASDQSIGISERVLYGVLSAAALKGVSYGWWDADMAAYIAGGAVTALGGTWAWWQNRPQRLLDRAAAQIPDKAKLVVTIDANASAKEKDEVHDLAKSSGDKVIAKVAPAPTS